MKTRLLTAVFLAYLTSALAQSTNSFPLWPNGAPGALGKKPEDIPTLTPFFPEAGKATGAALVICPGGGYAHLAPYEGADYARFFAQYGVTCFVLKYRLATDGYHYPEIFLDAARAMRTVRARATEWNVDPKRIGIVGSSAGGHLASTVLTHYDAGKPDDSDPIERVSSRPDLGILCYAVISFGDFAHTGSEKNLIGEHPAPELARELSNELHVTKETPVCFIWSTYEDKVVKVENSLLFAEALRKAGVPFDLHVYQKGPHGLGLGTKEWIPAKFHPWTADCVYWLKVQDFVKP